MSLIYIDWNGNREIEKGGKLFRKSIITRDDYFKMQERVVSQSNLSFYVCVKNKEYTCLFQKASVKYS